MSANASSTRRFSWSHKCSAATFSGLNLPPGYHHWHKHLCCNASFPLTHGIGSKPREWMNFRCSAQHLPLIVLSSARFGANIWGRSCWSMVESTVGASSRQAHQTISVAQKLLQHRASDAQTGQFQAKIHQCMPLNMPTQRSWGGIRRPQNSAFGLCLPQLYHSFFFGVCFFSTSQLKIPLRTLSFSSFNVLFSHWCLTLMTPFNFKNPNLRYIFWEKNVCQKNIEPMATSLLRNDNNNNNNNVSTSTSGNDAKAWSSRISAVSVASLEFPPAWIHPNHEWPRDDLLHGKEGSPPVIFLGRSGLMSMYIFKYQVSRGWSHITYLIKILIPDHESKKMLLNELPTVDGSKIPLTSWYGKNYPFILQWYFTSQMVSRISSIHSTIHNHQPHLLLPSLHQFLDQRLPRPWAFKSGLTEGPKAFQTRKRPVSGISDTDISIIYI